MCSCHAKTAKYERGHWGKSAITEHEVSQRFMLHRLDNYGPRVFGEGAKLEGLE
jgi:hypothetical protein